MLKQFLPQGCFYVMNAFTIKDLENLSGIKAHTIRIWEQRYNFLKPKRTETNIRFYNNEELRILLNVALLNKYGFKISHIDKMDDEELQNRVLSLSQSQAQQERIVNGLIQDMVELEIDRFEEEVDAYIARRRQEAAAIRREVEASQPDMLSLRARLLAQRKNTE